MATQKLESITLQQELEERDKLIEVNKYFNLIFDLWLISNYPLLVYFSIFVTNNILITIKPFRYNVIL